jgi:NAD(P)H-hydrate epimerase
MAHLTGMSVQQVQEDRIGVAKKFAVEHGCIVVLKGAGTVTATPEGEVYLNISGNPGMATAGTGDVLCGMIGSFLGQGLDSLEAAIAAVWLHGAAGDAAAEKKGEAGLIATDIIEMLPEAMRFNEE